VAWASLPHLPRYSAPRRPPSVRLGGLRWSRVAPIPCLLPEFVVSPEGLGTRRKPPVTPGPVVARSPKPGLWSRRPMALPRSRLPPLAPCPALRPRWWPAHSPYRTQDGCRPATGYRRLSPPYPLEG